MELRLLSLRFDAPGLSTVIGSLGIISLSTLAELGNSGEFVLEVIFSSAAASARPSNFALLLEE